MIYHLSRFIKITKLIRLPHYTLAWAVSDLIAGTTVGLTIIPQVKTSSHRSKSLEMLKIDYFFGHGELPILVISNYSVKGFSISLI